MDVIVAAGFGAVDKLSAAGDTATGTIVFTGAHALQIPAGAASGDVLTSDASGNAAWSAPTGGSSGPTGAAGGDLGSTYPNPTVVATHLASALPIAQGGTGSTSRVWAGLLTPTGVKTSAYTAVAGDFVPVSTAGGAVTITLPTTPPDLSVVSIKHVIQGATNVVTVNCPGSAVFNKTGGGTTATLTLLSQGLLLQYSSASQIWYVVADDLPLSQLDSRYAPGRALPLGTVTFTTGSTPNVDASTANTYAVTLTGSPTGATPSFAITNPAASGAETLDLFITQGGSGNYTINWPSNVTWLMGAAPTLATAISSLTVVQLETVNGGTTWYGAQVTGAPSLPLSVANGGTGQGLYSPIDNIWNAADMGYLTQTFDVTAAGTAGRGITSGVMSLMGVMVRTPVTVTGARVILQTSATLPVLTAGQSYLALYGSTAGGGGAGTLLGSGHTNSTAVELSTAWAVASTTAQQVVPLTAAGTGTLNLTPGMYWIAILSVGGTTPLFGSGNNVSGLVSNGLLPAASARNATQGSALTAPPATFTPTSNVLAQTSFWAALY